jgi:hypothetical protein
VVRGGVVVLTIDDPPERPVCTGCMSPLVWVFPARTRRWVAMVAESEMRLQVHQCDQRDPSPVRWVPDPERAERAARGSAFAREILAAKAQERTEKGAA